MWPFLAKRGLTNTHPMTVPGDLAGGVAAPLAATPVPAGESPNTRQAEPFYSSAEPLPEMLQPLKRKTQPTTLPSFHTSREIFFAGILLSVMTCPQAFLHLGDVSLCSPLHKLLTFATIILFPAFLAANHLIQLERAGPGFCEEPAKKATLPPLKMYTCSFSALIINCYKA